MSTNTLEQQQFYKACAKVRELWGLRTSTFEQITNAIAHAFVLSLAPSVDEKRAKTGFEALYFEWTQWRATYFLLQARKEVAASISKWPNGVHYYVRLFGEGVDVTEKFNRQADAQRFFDRQVSRYVAEGRKVLNTSI
jgi:hypothetical protein